MELRSGKIIKVHAVQRFLIWHYFQPLLKNIRVAEFPKSGGTWLCQMIGDLLNLQYPRNVRLPWNKCIQHSHYGGPAHSKTIVVIRDGRDVMTSAYFHFLVYAENKPVGMVDYWRSIIGDRDYENVRETMPYFIDKFNTNFRIGGRLARWSDHVLSYNCKEKSTLCVFYEDLLNNPKGELERIMKWYDVEPCAEFDSVIEKYSFLELSKRRPGEEDASSFLRKGIIGDWKNYFSPEALNIFSVYNKEAMKYFKYE